MKNLPFPIRTHDGLKIVITQLYGNPSNVQYYKDNGINMPFHNGVDAVLSGGDNLETYGSALITPSEGWRVHRTYWYDSAVASNENEVVLHSPAFVEDGIEKVVELRYAHLSEVSVKEGDILPAYAVIGYLGNSGLVSPKPTPYKPCSGAHLHLGMCEYRLVAGQRQILNGNNGVYGLIDPLTRFNPAITISGPDTGIEKDIPAFLWAFEKAGITERLEKIIFALKNWVKW